MDLQVGDKVELTNGKIATITCVAETLDGQIVYGIGTSPIVIAPCENIVRKIEE